MELSMAEMMVIESNLAWRYIYVSVQTPYLHLAIHTLVNRINRNFLSVAGRWNECCEQS